MQKATFQIGQKKVLGLQKLKIFLRGHNVLDDLNGKKIVGSFYEKELQKSNQGEFRIEKVIKRKVINYTSKGKVMIIHLIVGLIKKILLYKNELKQNRSRIRFA